MTEEEKPQGAQGSEEKGGILYKGHDVGEGRMHLLIEHCVVVELEAVERFTEGHVAQALPYLKATGHPLACSSSSTCLCSCAV